MVILTAIPKKSSTPIHVYGCSDSDHGSDPNDRISYTGYVFIVNGDPVSWTSHKQSTVALSTMEAEYMALSDASREAIARKQFFQELKIPSGSFPLIILSDNQSALGIAEDLPTIEKPSTLTSDTMQSVTSSGMRRLPLIISQLEHNRLIYSQKRLDPFHTTVVWN
jgi:hypothetical protein